MKRLAFIAILGISSVYFVGCGIGGDSKNGDSTESKSIDLSKIETLSNEDYSHLPECKIREDKINGCLETENHESGKYRSEFPYKNGKMNGVVREYFTDKTICEMRYVDSAPVSADICIDKDGKPKNGVMKEYYDNGNLAFEYIFKDGRKEGIVKAYHENGNLVLEFPYKDGKQDGVKRIYHDNGELLLEASFKNDKKDGVQKFYSKGKLYHESSFKDGKQDGKMKEYHEDGSLYFSVSYENDKAISGKCGDGKKIDDKKLREFNGRNTSVLGCD